MIKIFSITFFFFYSTHIYGQEVYQSDTWIQNTFTEVSNDEIEDIYLGCSTCKSKKREKADSLFNLISLNAALLYFSHKSYTIKYYAFLRILKLNDSMALECSKSALLDSTNLDIRSACMGRTEAFNSILLKNCYWVLYLKSKGVSGTIDASSYFYTESDKKIGKRQFKELKKFLTKQKVKINL